MRSRSQPLGRVGAEGQGRHPHRRGGRPPLPPPHQPAADRANPASPLVSNVCGAECCARPGPTKPFATDRRAVFARTRSPDGGPGRSCRTRPSPVSCDNRVISMAFRVHRCPPLSPWQRHCHHVNSSTGQGFSARSTLSWRRDLNSSTPCLQDRCATNCATPARPNLDAADRDSPRVHVPTGHGENGVSRRRCPSAAPRAPRCPTAR